MGLIDTATKQLLPWRTRLWDDNLQFVGGIQRIYAGDIAPDDSYFVVTSGSGGDRPPISDTAIAYPLGRQRQRPAAVDLAALRQHLLGGHHRAGRLHRRPLRLHRVADRARPVARPRQRRLRHRPGPGRLRPRRRGGPPRPHRRAQPGRRQGARVEPRAPTPSRATRPWRPPARPVHRRRRHVPGRRQHRPRRVLRLQHRPGAHGPRHHDHRPDRGPGGRRPASSSRSPAPPRRPPARRPGAGPDPGPRQQPVPPGQPHHLGRRPTPSTPRWPPPNATSTAWSLPVTITTNRNLQV